MDHTILVHVLFNLCISNVQVSRVNSLNFHEEEAYYNCPVIGSDLWCKFYQ